MTTQTHTLAGNDLEVLLARVPAELGPEATIVEANKVRTGGIAGFFSRERFEVVVEVPAGAAPQSPRLSTESPGFAGILDRMVRDAGAADTAPDAARPRPLSAPASTDELDAFEPLLPARVETSPAIAPAATPGKGIAAQPALPALTSLDQAALVRVGLPPELTARRTTVSDDPAVELFHLLDRLPRPAALPIGRGSVLAVAGRRAEAMKVAEAFARHLSINPDEILVAASTFRGAGVREDRRLSEPGAAAERRRSWRRRKLPTIVAVECPVGRTKGSWANDLLDAIEPTMIWGVVDAGRKVEDIEAWSDQLGGIDALAVNRLDETVSPASVLGAGIPVGLLDGVEATTNRWAAVLADQLAVAA